MLRDRRRMGEVFIPCCWASSPVCWSSTPADRPRKHEQPRIRAGMKNSKLITSVLAFVLAIIVAAAAAERPPLTFKFTTTNVPGAIQTTPAGVNNAGVSVGQYEDRSKVFHGYLLDGKRLTTLDDPKGSNTVCANLNPNGEISIVGAYTNSMGNSVGFLHHEGEFTDIPGPAGATASAAYGINDSGAIVGFYKDSSGVTHGFLLKGKTYTTLDVPGASSTVALGINNGGSIVLFWVNSKGAIESSIYNGETYKTINVPGAASSFAENINSSGDVVYGWLDSSNVSHGALLHEGKYYKFNFPKSARTYGGGINDHNLIVGGYQTKSGGPFSGFKATFK
jgi:probable HAF family extracellular repeat protein